MRIIPLLLILLVPYLAFAQPAIGQYDGKIEIDQPEEVTLLLEKHRQFIEELKYIEGWLLQVNSTTKLSEAESSKAEFMKAFRDIPAYITFDPPNYNLRVGAYLSKVDAYSRLYEIQEKFPKAFPVMGYIKIVDLK